MTGEEELAKRLRELWVIATNTCGAASSQVIQEIKEIEKELEALNSAPKVIRHE